MRCPGCLIVYTVWTPRAIEIPAAAVWGCPSASISFKSRRTDLAEQSRLGGLTIGIALPLMETENR